MRTMTKDERQQHVHMILTPNDWPRWPTLPLKHTDRIDAGVILAISKFYPTPEDPDQPIYVFITNMFALPTLKKINPRTGKEITMLDHQALLAGPHEVHQGPYSILDAGWVVD